MSEELQEAMKPKFVVRQVFSYDLASLLNTADAAGYAIKNIFQYRGEFTVVAVRKDGQ